METNKSKLKNNSVLLGLALTFYIGYALINSFSFRLMKIVPIMDNSLFTSLIPIFLIFLYFILSDKKELHRLKGFLIFYLSLLFILLITYMLNPNYRYWYFEYDRGVLKYLLRPDSGIYAILFFSLFKQNEKDELKKYFTIGVFLVFIHDILQYAQSILNGYWLNTNGLGIEIKRSYDLDFGYSMALVSVFSIYKIYISSNRRLKLSYLFIMIGTSLIIFNNGSRGALLPIIVAVLIFFTKSILDRRNNINEKESINKINNKYINFFLMLAIIFLILIISIEVFNIYDLVSGDQNDNVILNKGTQDVVVQDKENRSLEMIKNKEIFDGNGREKIYSLVFNAVKESPIWGLGIFGDRPLASQILVWGHSHSVVLEFWADYGFIFGTLFLLLYIFISFRMIFFEKNRQLQAFYAIFFASSMELLFSHSYWLVSYPWICLVLFFKFSNLWLEDKEKIKTKIKIKNNKYLKRGITLMLTLLLLFSSANLYKYNKEYRKDLIKFNEPTAVLIFDNFTNREKETALKVANKEIPASFFIKTSYIGKMDYMKAEDLKQLEEKNIDIQSGLYKYRNISSMSEEDISKDIKESEIFFKSHGLRKPIAFSPQSGYLTNGNIDQLSKEFNIIRVKSKAGELKDATYSSLNKEDLLFLYTFDILAKKFDIDSDDDVIKNQIDLAYKNKNLILLRFDTTKASDKKYEKNEAELLSILSYMEDLGFQFINLSELNEQIKK